mgnify:CR=1 FL=1
MSIQSYPQVQKSPNYHDKGILTKQVNNHLINDGTFTPTKYDTITT